MADGSNIDLVAIVRSGTTVAGVNAAIAAAADGSEVIDYTEDPIVSSDVIGNPHSAIWDAGATMVIGETMIKAVIWFDNGWGYAARVVDTIGKLAAFDRAGATT